MGVDKIGGIVHTTGMAYIGPIGSLTLNKYGDPLLIKQANTLLRLRRARGVSLQGTELLREILKTTLPLLLAEETELARKAT